MVTIKILFSALGILFFPMSSVFAVVTVCNHSARTVALDVVQDSVSYGLRVGSDFMLTRLDPDEVTLGGAAGETWVIDTEKDYILLLTRTGPLGNVTHGILSEAIPASPSFWTEERVITVVKILCGLFGASLFFALVKIWRPI